MLGVSFISNFPHRDFAKDELKLMMKLTKGNLFRGQVKRRKKRKKKYKSILVNKGKKKKKKKE